MQIYDAADATGDGSAHTLASFFTGFKTAKWFQITAVAVADDTKPIRVGGSAVGGTRGVAVYAKGNFQTPTVADLGSLYDLESIYVRAETNDKFSVAVAQ